jgi:hypothetical protein
MNRDFPVTLATTAAAAAVWFMALGCALGRLPCLVTDALKDCLTWGCDPTLLLLLMLML